jgi:hypothetical protein
MTHGSRVAARMMSYAANGDRVSKAIIAEADAGLLSVKGLLVNVGPFDGLEHAGANKGVRANARRRPCHFRTSSRRITTGSCR